MGSSQSNMRHLSVAPMIFNPRTPRRNLNFSNFVLKYSRFMPSFNRCNLLTEILFVITAAAPVSFVLAAGQIQYSGSSVPKFLSIGVLRAALKPLSRKTPNNSFKPTPLRGAA